MLSPFRQIGEKLRICRSCQCSWTVILVLAVAVNLGTIGARADVVGAPGVATSSTNLVPDQRASTVAVPPAASPLGTLSGRVMLDLRITLAPRNPVALAAEMSALYDRSSPDYHHWLAVGEFDRRYGPSRAEVASSRAWLQARGLTDTRVSGFAIDVTASAAAASRAFGAKLESYRGRSGEVGYSLTTAPLVPAGLAAGTVQSIIGLNSLEAPVPQGAGVGPATGSCAPANGMTDFEEFTYPQIEHDYGIDKLVAAGQDGAGQTVALYELEGHDAGVAAYDSCFGLSPTITTRAVDGGGSQQNGGDDEADADIEAVAAAAPAADIESYEAPNTGADAYDEWAAIAADDNAQVVSVSWATCEAYAPGGPYDTLLEQAAAQGQSVQVASGDWGAQGCLYTDPSATTPAVEYPASSPYVTAVGGTTLAVDGSEAAWNWCRHYVAPTGCEVGAGGGGISSYEKAQAPQEAVTGVAARQVPDISANAGTAMVVNVDGAWDQLAGTSLATPIVASLIADRNDGCTTKTGLFTSALYTAASSLYGTGLDDVTTGDIDLTGTNGGAYVAGVGYDLATGLGTPLATGLTCADVTGASATTSPAGSHLTLSGFGLEGATVHFGTVVAAVVSSTATSATVTVPAGTGTVAISATSALGAGDDSVSFTYAMSEARVPGVPDAPTAVPGDHAAVVNVTDSSGGAPQFFTITAHDAAAPSRGDETATVDGVSGSARVTGLSDGDTYTFTATATNGEGASAPSVGSNPVIPTAPTSPRAPTPPPPSPLPLGTPLAPRATAGRANAVVAVSDPAIPGHTATPTSYALASVDLSDGRRGGQRCTVTGGAGTCAVAHLTSGDRYEFTAVAHDANHVSATSPPSNVVVPTGPTPEGDSGRTTLRVTITGADPTVADRAKVETITVRNLGTSAATNLNLTLTKVKLIAVRSAPGWSRHGQVLLRRLVRLGAGTAITYRITLYLRSVPSGIRYLTVIVTAENANSVAARHRFG